MTPTLLSREKSICTRGMFCASAYRSNKAIKDTAIHADKLATAGDNSITLRTICEQAACYSPQISISEPFRFEQPAQAVT